MVGGLASRLLEFFEGQSDDSLRSIIAYEPDSYEVYFLRDDVATQYTPAELESAIKDTRLDSLTSPLYESSFSDDHGALRCLVQVFESAVEMNVIIDDGRGVAVGLDAAALEELCGIVAEVRETVLDVHRTPPPDTSPNSKSAENAPH